MQPHRLRRWARRSRRGASRCLGDEVLAADATRSQPDPKVPLALLEPEMSSRQAGPRECHGGHLRARRLRGPAERGDGGDS